MKKKQYKEEDADDVEIKNEDEGDDNHNNNNVHENEEDDEDELAPDTEQETVPLTPSSTKRVPKDFSTAIKNQTSNTIEKITNKLHRNNKDTEPVTLLTATIEATNATKKRRRRGR